MTKLLQQNGLLVLNKPKGPTSAGCIGQVKRALQQKKIGHAGTLDPMADGVLHVLLGQGTKIAGYLTEGLKVYSGRLLLGKTTDTYDAEGETVQESPWEHITEEQILADVQGWTELPFQDIPPYSAAKHKGKPLYKLAREGKETPIKRRPLKVTQAEVLEMDLPYVRFRVECGAGTYIRSLVHSLGIRLECGATLTQLTREYSHPFGLEQAYDLQQVLDEPDKLAGRVLPLDQALSHWPRFCVDEKQAANVKNGMRIPCEDTDFDGDTQKKDAPTRAILLAPDAAPLALVEIRHEGDTPVWAILRGLWQG